MIDIAGYTFDDHQTTFVCTHVFDGMPVLAFCHDSEGDVQFLCGADGHGADECVLVGLVHMLEQIRAIREIPVVHPGKLATRDYPGGPWSIGPSSA